MAKKPKVPAHVSRRAEELVAKIAAGEVIPRRVIHVPSVYVVEIGMRWRLVSTDHGKTYAPMSHEAYNRKVSKCSQP